MSNGIPICEFVQTSIEYPHGIPAISTALKLLYILRGNADPKNIEFNTYKCPACGCKVVYKISTIEGKFRSSGLNSDAGHSTRVEPRFNVRSDVAPGTCILAGRSRD
jgi:hypothetical protein